MGSIPRFFRQHLPLAIVLVLVLSALPVQAQPRGGVTLYSDRGFRGASESFRGDVPRLSETRFGARRASSLRVAEGCRVTLYREPDFLGAAVGLAYDQRDLSATPVGNDAAESLRVDCRSGGYPPGGYPPGDYPPGDDYGEYDPPGVIPPGERGLTLYSEAGFRGSGELFRGDDPDLRGNTVRNDSASSLRITPGCRAEIFEDSNFRGESLVVTRDISDLRGQLVGNDSVSSIRVSCHLYAEDWDASEGVVLYEDAGFRGRGEVFYVDDPDLRDNLIGSDRVSSLRLAPGCRVILHTDARYRGRSIAIDRDVDNLGRTPVGNDSVSSLRVDCRRYR